MARTIVICCDGTGNTFDGEPTNVTRLIRFLDLTDPQRQVAVYAQGVGTNGVRISAVRDHGPALQTFTPRESRLAAHTAVLRVLGLGFGYGLKPLVREMYRRLAELHTDADDRIYLFGFSRGAFAVRALAGLIYRCGLPQRVDRRTFNRAWRLFKPMTVPAAKVQAFRAVPGNRVPEIEFLGVWDTVKSYGGLVPTKLPHLRHNPIVRHVAHALALHERRAWFKATTWGQLDMDKARARRWTAQNLRTGSGTAYRPSPRFGSPAFTATSAPATSRCAGCSARPCTARPVWHSARTPTPSWPGPTPHRR